MTDRAELLIGDSRMERFSSYRVTSDLFAAADDFEIVIAGEDDDARPVERCVLKINGQVELVGVIDARTVSSGPDGSRLTISGRDLMGLLVDAHAEEFPTLEEIELKDLADRLLKNVPFINRKAIRYMKGNKLRAVELSGRREEFEFAQVQPGQSVFDVLRDYALSRGLMFFALPDGTFVLGEPRTSGNAGFSLTRRLDGRGNNIVNGEFARDISGEYSKVTVVGQQQDLGLDDPAEVNASATVENPGFPFYKPFVATAEHDAKDPGKLARIMIENQRFRSFQLRYTVQGHSQDGRNWQVNAIAHVLDEAPRFGINGDFLVYGRTFSRSVDGGTATELMLSRLGVLPA